MLSTQLPRDFNDTAAAAPLGSVLLTTFNAYHNNYNSVPSEKSSRLRTLQSLLGDPLTDGLDENAIERRNFSTTLSNLLHRKIAALVNDAGRESSYVPMFVIEYSDGAPMLTVGGMIPPVGMEKSIEEIVDGPEWPGRPARSINFSGLTMREFLAFRSLLPATQISVEDLGFPLPENEIEGVAEHYMRFPIYRMWRTWLSV